MWVRLTLLMLLLLLVVVLLLKEVRTFQGEGGLTIAHADKAPMKPAG